MIRYTLKCAKSHEFESWFKSADDFDRLAASDLVACAQCGSTKVTKTIMAPAIGAGAPKPATEADVASAKIKELRAQVEQNADYVGTSFASEARKIHEGSNPERAIYGEANLAEAKALVDDGIPVAPLPFMSRKRVN